MNILLVLIPLSVVLLALGVWAFFWSVDHAQFDDLDTPALTPLEDDQAPRAQPQLPSTQASREAP
jgi:cbb3-type cytochrome oxidase maturation protein